MKRWPGWVYDGEDEPDYRFVLANERTLLSWLRTALALLAAGVVLDALGTSSAALTRLLSTALVALALGASIAAWVRWAPTERAIRSGAPLPALVYGLVLSIGLIGIGLCLLVVSLASGSGP